jgi:hypothetical protein
VNYHAWLLAPDGPLSIRALSPEGAIEARREHIARVAAEYRAYRQSPEYLRFAADQRSLSMRTAYAVDPSLRDY